MEYRSLFRAVPTPLLVLNPDLLIVDANDAYLASTMRRRDDLMGRLVFEAFPDNPHDPAASGVEMLGASLRRVLRERVTDVMAIQKYDIPRPGGGYETRYWAPANAPVFASDGELRWIVHRVEDVTPFMRAHRDDPRGLEELSELRTRTEQMAAEVFARRELQERNEVLHALLDSLDTAVVGCDTDGRPALHNEAARRLLGDLLDGVPVQEWPRHRYMFHPDGRRMQGEDVPLSRVLRGERVRDVEVVVRPPTAPQRIFSANGRPVPDRPGLAAVVALHEVTLLRRAALYKECELEISRLTSRSGRPEEVLAEVMGVIGAKIGWSAVEFWSVDDVAEVLRRSSRWDEPGHRLPRPLTDPLLCGQELPGRAWQTAEPVWAQAALAVPVPSGSAVLGVVACYSDITEVPDDARTLIMTGIGAQIGGFLERGRAERLAAELDRTRDEYISLVGHELRTPLTSIQSTAEMMLEEPGASGEHRVMLQVIQRNTATLHTIVRKLLDVAGLRSGHLDLHPQLMDLTTVVRASVEAARATAPGETAIEVDAPPAAPLHGDPGRLRQVVDELLANALTWAIPGSTVGVSVHTAPRAVTLAVSNTGNPIPAEERDQLFDPFFRSDTVRHGGIPGAGLGLTVARAIVEQHSGTITVREPGETTTTFTVRLPTGVPS
ncbi:ATP-binding protein [Actinoplanes sp. NPDC049548]|uniref:PAS domain-containing sensor histidine kinase n=1 Tax=Actinoplanes sp. NPDC049548 TaxID=3155152 RepID=UPI003441FA21